MASFELVQMTENGPVALKHLGIFTDGKMAASVAASTALLTPGVKIQPRPIATSLDWHQREKERFAKGEYSVLPWRDMLPEIPGHYARVASSNKDSVSFLATEVSGKTDRPTTWVVNRYLLKFYPDLSVEQRRSIVWKHNGQSETFEIKFAATADEIQQVYRQGPDSCMSHGPGFYASSRHPVRAYAGPDLQVAYIENEDGDIVARSVVWPAKKIHSRIYGDETKLYKGLRRLGYTLNHVDFEGARLSLIPDAGFFDEDDRDCDGYACPYLDFAEAVEPIENHLVVTRKGTYDCRYQSGIAEASPRRCPKCGEMRCSEAFSVDDSDNICCADCASKGTKLDAFSGYDIGPRVQVAPLVGGRFTTAHTATYECFTCPVTGELELKRDDIMFSGELYSEEGLRRMREKAA